MMILLSGKIDNWIKHYKPYKILLWNIQIDMLMGMVLKLKSLSLYSIDFQDIVIKKTDNLTYIIYFNFEW